MANNKEIAQNVLAAVGGSANIKSATHCMTRLRLYLKDDTIPQDDQRVVRQRYQQQNSCGVQVPDAGRQTVQWQYSLRVQTDSR